MRFNEFYKLFEAPEDIRNQIEKTVNSISDEADLSDILKFTNRFTIKKDVEKFTTLRQYKGLVASVLLQSLADSSLSKPQIQKFLKQLAGDGILNEKTLLTPRQVHTLGSLIDDTYQTEFDAIKLDLFQKISGKIGEMGDVGKGEYMLDIISPHVNRRGAPGDLDVDGTKIELKAGDNGRLGPAGSMSLAGRFQRDFLPFIVKLVGKERAATIKSPTDFNFKQNMSYFTDFFGDAKTVKIALTEMLKMHYPGIDVSSIVNTVVDGSGNIDGQKLKQEMLKTSYAAYKAAKEFDGVVIMDSGVTKFLYINTPDDIAAVSNSLLVSFPSWTDTQGNCMKVTLAKGGKGGVVGDTVRAGPANIPNKPKVTKAPQKPEQPAPAASNQEKAEAVKSDMMNKIYPWVHDRLTKKQIDDPELETQILTTADYLIDNGSTNVLQDLKNKFPDLA